MADIIIVFVICIKVIVFNIIIITIVIKVTLMIIIIIINSKVNKSLLLSSLIIPTISNIIFLEFHPYQTLKFLITLIIKCIVEFKALLLCLSPSVACASTPSHGCRWGSEIIKTLLLMIIMIIMMIMMIIVVMMCFNTFPWMQVGLRGFDTQDDHDNHKRHGDQYHGDHDNQRSEPLTGEGHPRGAGGQPSTWDDGGHLHLLLHYRVPSKVTQNYFQKLYEWMCD